LVLGIKLYRDEMPETTSIMPLAFPLIAGAGTLTTLLSMRAEYQVQNIIVGIALNMIFVYAVLKSSKWIEKVIGPSGIAVIRKVFGVILLSIAIKLFKTNLGF
jgi:multiple antibiotic resistance protein